MVARRRHDTEYERIVWNECELGHRSRHRSQGLAADISANRCRYGLIRYLGSQRS
jgi:hypothetical protein